MIKIKSVKGNQQFYSDIQNMCDKGYDIMDSITTYCEKNKVDIEVAGSWIKQSSILKQRMQDYAINNFLLKSEE